MKKYTKALIIALILILIGTAITAVVFAIGGSDVFFAPTKMREERTEITQSFKSIEITEEAGDVKILPSQDGKCSADVFDGKKVTHSIAVESGVLKIKRTDERKWYETILPAKDDNGVILYLPEGDYGFLDITVSSGDVEVRSTSNTQFESVLCTVSSGDIELDGVHAYDCALTSTSGDVGTENVNVRGDMTVMTSSGDAEFENVTVDGDLTVNTSSGDVEFENVTVKGKKTVRTSSGDISYGD